VSRLEELFGELVYPACVRAGILPAGRFVISADSIADRAAGVDGWVVEPSGATHGIAIRMSGAPDRQTFTIRDELTSGRLTEMAKRTASVVAGGSYPSLTAQAYGDWPHLLNCYVVRTDDLYRHIVLEPGRNGTPPRYCSCVGDRMLAMGGNWFYPVAIGEKAMTYRSTHGTLIGHGVAVRSLHPVEATAGLVL